MLVPGWVYLLAEAVVAACFARRSFSQLQGFCFGELAPIALEFQREDPSPSTEHPCPRFWKGHVMPFACGPDAVSDLEWQTIGDAKAQDVGTKGVRSAAAGLSRRRTKVWLLDNSAYLEWVQVERLDRLHSIAERGSDSENLHFYTSGSALGGRTNPLAREGARVRSARFRRGHAR